MTKEDYAKNYSTGHAAASAGSRTIVPEDIQRVCVHEPCFFCGEAKGLCRHRRPW